MRTALITGITGQDGSYLAELLLNRGYQVHGIIRRSSTFNTSRIDHIYSDPHDPQSRLFLHYGDLTDSEQISNIIYNIKPDEVYHLGAQSHVRVSFDVPEYTGNVTALGTTRILEMIKGSGTSIRFYQASSSEIFGLTLPPQNEGSILRPASPYAAAKAYAFWMTANYRNAYKLFASNGILFNHESPRRGETFVTRKITRAIAGILAKKERYLYLGSTAPKRDWGYAPEYVEAMWRVLQLDEPTDLVIGSGESHSVGEFVETAFGYVGLRPEDYVKSDPRYLRPSEPEDLRADPTRARKLIKWKPRIGFRELVKIMIDADMRRLGLKPPGEGDAILETAFSDKWWKVD